MGVSEEPLIISPMMTNLPEGTYNIQTVTVEDAAAAAAAQYQTLLTVPYSEILVLDQSQIKTLITPEVQLVVADVSGQSQIVSEPVVIYVPQEVTTANNLEQDSEAQIARQWYEDSLVATQALNSLTQALSQILTEETVDSVAENTENMSVAKD